MVDVSARHAEPDDTRSVHRMLSGPQATVSTTQLPPQSVESVRKRFIFETHEGPYRLVVCVGEGRTRKVVAENPRGYAKNMTKCGSWQVPCGSRAETPQGSALRSTVAKACQLSKA
jgi:hypothetical protein